MLGPHHIPGINNAAWHGLFIHYVVGLWITPAGYVLIYYFLRPAWKNPIYSPRGSQLSRLGGRVYYPSSGIATSTRDRRWARRSRRRDDDDIRCGRPPASGTMSARRSSRNSRRSSDRRARIRTGRLVREGSLEALDRCRAAEHVHPDCQSSSRHRDSSPPVGFVVVGDRRQDVSLAAARQRPRCGARVGL